MASKSYALPVLQPRAVKKGFRIDPLQDRRWEPFLQKHPDASLFHSSAWLRALRETYGYQPVAYTTSSPDEKLTNAVVFCEVKSWLTGKRLVSLPFSDHCQPLLDSSSDEDLASAALQEFRKEDWDYVEFRPINGGTIQTALLPTMVKYSFHVVDLRPDLDKLYRSFHKSSIERKIRRAEREQLVYREGRSEQYLDYFYGLFMMTRKRHRLPPPPRAWFANLMKSFGETLKVRVAFKDEKAVAAMITIAYKDTLTYKYGCCDPKFNPLGCMHLLYWKTIQDGKASGQKFLDLGRTDAGQHGLITFKNRWGAKQSEITYLRYGSAASSTHIFDISTTKWKASMAKGVMHLLPPSVVSKVGQWLYAHVG